MYLEQGEEIDGGGIRCPGEGQCQRWDAQKGDTFAEKSRACEQCPQNCKPPLEDNAQCTMHNAESEEVERLVDRIAYLVAWENARPQSTDWSQYSFDMQKLYVIWRNHEIDIALIRRLREQQLTKLQTAMIEAQLSKP